MKVIDHMNANLAIVGGGAAGVATFIAAVKRRAAGTIHIIDPRPVGPGIAFSNTDPDVICNTSVDTMSVVSGHPLDFLDYLQSRGYAATPSSFVPRSLVGDYLTDRFQRYREVARRNGIDVFCWAYQFHSLRIDDHHRYELRLSRLTRRQSLIVTDVVFCTGHGAARVPEILMPHRDHPTFVGCPYPETEMLAKVPAKSRVLVIGSKLSAIDAAILLCREGHSVTMVSPSGEIPGVRARFIRSENISFDLDRMESLLTRWNDQAAGPCPTSLKYAYLKYAAQTLSENTRKPWRTQFSHAIPYDERLREEIAIAEQGDCSWQDMVVGFLHAANSVYLKNKERFIGGLHPGFRDILHRYVTAIALANAEKLMRHIDNGALTIKRGELRHVATSDAGYDQWLVDWGEGLQRFDAVVATTGYHFPYYVFNDAGELEIDVEGSRPEQAIDISRDMAAHDPGLADRESIWFVGPPAHMRLFVPNALIIVAPLADQVIVNMMDFFDYDRASDQRFSIPLKAS
ncbi:FAD/NAD(P)-binding protein [Phyllobacterium phragmitis]|nr:FAD/NAD(P)-binding protein [Phyllobacterium phragmitis]